MRTNHLYNTLINVHIFLSQSNKNSNRIYKLEMKTVYVGDNFEMTVTDSLH